MKIKVFDRFIKIFDERRDLGFDIADTTAQELECAVVAFVTILEEQQREIDQLKKHVYHVNSYEKDDEDF